MIEELLATGIEWLLGSSGQTTVVLVLLLAIVYFRKALGLGSLLADWVSRAIFASGVLLVLLVTGVIPGINVERASELFNDGIAFGVDLVTQIL